jgi:carbon storage regulator
MLILVRKPDQSIHIGDDIKITVKAVVGDKVRIAIEAPRDITVLRDELYDVPVEAVARPDVAA